MIRVFYSVLLCAGLLAGCGNTGNLYLPEAVATKPGKISRITDPAPESGAANKDDESETEQP